MSELLSIGDFARATHLSIKALRHYHYHDQGLLEPAEIDATSGYRRYRIEQIPTAQIIHRFRGLGMPLDDIRDGLQTDDLAARNELIARHLRRLERELTNTQNGALGELYAVLDSQHIHDPGTAAGIYADELFTHEHGQATMYFPITAALRPAGRVHLTELPPVELAVIAHDGPDEGIDRAYGALANYVSRHALAVDGPIHEFYPVNRHHTADRSHWRTEVGWPVFATSTPR